MGRAKEELCSFVCNGQLQGYLNVMGLLLKVYINVFFPSAI